MSATATVACEACGAQTPAGKRFCIHCGTPRQSSCGTCGESLLPGARFCAECGTPVPGASGATRAASPGGPGAGPSEPISERRLVSVLFADLVGFTTMSEHRDPEEIRELLSRYFDRCRALIERYGGTVEKFIGDAVMAVWGTPVAREDDAERAVRAALALTQAITLLGEEVGMPELRVRAGVLTGRAAVELGAEGEGMVLGDTVNTASRLQSLAEPGTVLVDDVTRHASEAAIAYEDAGVHPVKGREQPVHAWHALRVVAGTRGARRSAGLEAPLVGRERELHTIIESYEASVLERRAQMVTVTGEAGAGKSRLLWEYFKYVDGIERVVRWHQGRCLSYGEGVGYWALADMVRARAGILEDEEPASARQKLRAAVHEHVSDERERRLVEPRLAHLLGLEQRTAVDRADLFSGWRLFFERIATMEPVVLAFEDLQWADSGLLDFIDYLLEWSAEFPIFILALGRPELRAARPEWEITIELGPLGADAMTELLTGLVPGLPEATAQQILRRAEGVPLYAVETVRMLLDRGLLVQEGSRYVVTGDVAAVDTPETLQALVAARLDNLDARERALLQDAAVIGQSFPPATLVAISGRPTEEVTRSLDALVQKQVLRFIDEPLSAERGQYVFLQALLRGVALGTLSRRDRKARHLAVAQYLRETWGEEAGDVAEVLASHYLDAVEADPEAADAAQIRAQACQTLEDAGRRALSLALGPEARRHFERAAQLSNDPATRGRLLREAGAAAISSSEYETALELLPEASALLRENGLEEDAIAADLLIGDVHWNGGRFQQSLEIAEAAWAALGEGGDESLRARLLARRAMIVFNLGQRAEALELADQALEIADGRELWSTTIEAMISKGIAMAEMARPHEAHALIRHATDLAIEHDQTEQAIRGFYNLADTSAGRSSYEEALELLDEGLEIARRRGDRVGERRLQAQSLYPLHYLGRWDECQKRAEELARTDDVWGQQGLMILPFILVSRGETETLGPLRERASMEIDWSVMESASHVARALLDRGTGDDALATSLQPAVDAAKELLTIATCEVAIQYAEAVDLALAAGRPELAEELVTVAEGLPPGLQLPLIQAETRRARAVVAAQRGQPDTAETEFRRALELASRYDNPFVVARIQLQLAELLSATGQPSEEIAPLRDEAAAVFEQLGATPWLTRAEALSRRGAAGGVAVSSELTA